jgi:aminoacyl tRNA synthase complex-interacting multifunctional protein 1
VLAAASALSPAFSSVLFDLASAPPIERKVDASKKKEKAAAVGEQVEPTAVATSKEDKSLEDRPKEKKEKKKDAAAADNGGKKKEKAAAPAGGKAVAEDAGEPVPSMIDMRIGHIVDGESISALRFLSLANNLHSKKAPRG